MSRVVYLLTCFCCFQSELYELLNTTLSDSSDEDAEYEPDTVENAVSDVRYSRPVNSEWGIGFLLEGE